MHSAFALPLPKLSRRALLGRAANGFGSLALAALMNSPEQSRAAAPFVANPASPDWTRPQPIPLLGRIAAEAGDMRVATNIALTHQGAEVGMITTEGFRDILHIARHKKPLNFSNYQDLPWQRYPVVRRRYRLTVPERIAGDGSVLVPLDEERAREQVRALKEALAQGPMRGLLEGVSVR